MVKIKAGNYDTGGGSNLQDIEEKHGIVSDISIGYKQRKDRLMQLVLFAIHMIFKALCQ